MLSSTRLPCPEMLAQLQLPKDDVTLPTKKLVEREFDLVSETCCFSVKSLKSELTSLNEEYF